MMATSRTGLGDNRSILINVLALSLLVDRATLLFKRFFRFANDRCGCHEPPVRLAARVRSGYEKRQFATLPPEFQSYLIFRKVGFYAYDGHGASGIITVTGEFDCQRPAYFPQHGDIIRVGVV